jgi:hypothetical protein
MRLPSTVGRNELHSFQTLLFGQQKYILNPGGFQISLLKERTKEGTSTKRTDMAKV